MLANPLLLGPILASTTAYTASTASTAYSFTGTTSSLSRHSRTDTACWWETTQEVVLVAARHISLARSARNYRGNFV